MVQSVSQMLSSFTHMAGLVTLPNPHYVALSQIEFISLSENRALAIMVMNNHEVQNRVVQLDRHYSPEALRRAATYLNEAFAGRSLPDVRAMLLAQLRDTQQDMNHLMLDAIQVAQKVFEKNPAERVEYVIAGETNLMGFAELSNVDRLRRLFEAFNEKHDILRLLDNCLHADGIHIFIGQESGYQILDEVSVFSALPQTTSDPVANNDLTRKSYVLSLVLGTLTTIEDGPFPTKIVVKPGGAIAKTGSPTRSSWGLSPSSPARAM